MSETQKTFAVVVWHPRNPMAGQYIQGPRTPTQVKRNGYGFTKSKAQAWLFPSRPKAFAKARIVARHMGWSDHDLLVEANPQLSPSGGDAPN